MQITNRLDENLWRAFVEGHPQGNIFHTPEMYRVFARARSHRPELWAAVEETGQVRALLLPVLISVLEGPLHYLTTRAVVFGSVLCTPDRAGQEALRLLLRGYRRKSRRSVLFTELRNYSDISHLQPVLEPNGFSYEEHLNFLIDLDRPLEQIWQGIRTSARRNIQKAQKSGVEVEEVISLSELPLAYDMLRQIYKRIQVPLPDQSLFEAAFEILNPLGMFRILAAKIDETWIGVLSLLIYKGVILYWYTGTLREYSSYRAGDLLVWRAIELGHQTGCATFDFGGGGKPHEKYGVRDFKAKFGGDLVNFGRNTCVHSPLRLKLTQLGYQVMRRYL
jgi:lipid II:glycine glycyltransferase (peptidoglycan interpeptide bridge formation enzyme)